jgi:hypothetical protein
MVRPFSFQTNEETASTNAFQRTDHGSDVLKRALSEFEGLRNKLIAHGIEVVCQDEPTSAQTPDAIFPNNWFAVLPDGNVFLFPMYAPNRRREVQPTWISPYLRQPQMIDLRSMCDRNLFLEGTGSLILNHDKKIGYACLSERTNIEPIHEFERLSGYKIHTFHASDRSGLPFYHTNVMMAHGIKTAVVCLESVTSENERKKLCDVFAEAGQKIIEISQDQVLKFAGNMLLLSNRSGKRYWVCSESALQSLTPAQRSALEQDGEFISSPLKTIEDVGGGSARCMLGELY